VSVETAFEMQENKYNRRVNFTESKAIYLWMNGKSFSEVIEYTDLEEGKFYNLIMRMYILCEEIKNFYAIIENTKLSEKFSKAREMLIRDIFSCKSLYLQDISLNV
jgi:superfamily II RNA helicase